MGIRKFKDYCVRRDAATVRDLKEAEKPAEPTEDAATAADRMLRKLGYGGPMRRLPPSEKTPAPPPRTFSPPEADPTPDAPPTPPAPIGKPKKDVYDKAIEKDGKNSRAQVSPEDEETIVKLARKGWTPLAISLELPGNVPPGAVARVIKSRADAVPPAPLDPKNPGRNMGPDSTFAVNTFKPKKRGQPGFDPNVQTFGKPIGKRDKGIEDKHLS